MARKKRSGGHCRPKPEPATTPPVPQDELARHYRQLLNNTPELYTGCLRVFDYWAQRVTAERAYQLAKAAYSDEAKYQRLKRHLGVM